MEKKANDIEQKMKIHLVQKRNQRNRLIANKTNIDINGSLLIIIIITIIIIMRELNFRW